MRTTLRALACLVALLSMAARARAGNEEDAKAAFQEGKRAFERGDYEGALTQFHRADMLLPSPKLSYNIGACYERLGKYQDAVLAFERYLQLVGPPASNDENERKFQQDLRARIASDRARYETRAPTSVGPPPANSPTNAATMPSMPLAKEQRIVDAKRRRSAGIALSAIGGSVLAVGLTLLIHGAVAPFDSGFGDDGLYYTYGIFSITEMTFGVLGTILGVSMGIPGVAQLVSAQRTLHELSFAPPEPRTPFSPQRANVFSIPVLRF